MRRLGKIIAYDLTSLLGDQPTVKPSAKPKAEKRLDPGLEFFKQPYVP